ncbi:hypothetical protein NOR53_634 [gamma proteobacterium NOR5-3]|nr:hypothetical protein NOR53_634 [gamma proteobacterium NOR5-3]
MPMNKQTYRSTSDACPSRDFAEATRADGGVYVESQEWDSALRAYRSTTVLLSSAEATQLAFDLIKAAGSEADASAWKVAMFLMADKG